MCNTHHIDNSSNSKGLFLRANNYFLNGPLGRSFCSYRSLHLLRSLALFMDLLIYIEISYVHAVNEQEQSQLSSLEIHPECVHAVDVISCIAHWCSGRLLQLTIAINILIRNKPGVFSRCRCDFIYRSLVQWYTLQLTIAIDILTRNKLGVCSRCKCDFIYCFPVQWYTFTIKNHDLLCN